VLLTRLLNLGSGSYLPTLGSASRPARDKHSGLIQTFAKYSRKKLDNIRPSLKCTHKYLLYLTITDSAAIFLIKKRQKIYYFINAPSQIFCWKDKKIMLKHALKALVYSFKTSCVIFRKRVRKKVTFY
jgi:hypothetical protein